MYMRPSEKNSIVMHDGDNNVDEILEIRAQLDTAKESRTPKVTPGLAVDYDSRGKLKQMAPRQAVTELRLQLGAINEINNNLIKEESKEHGHKVHDHLSKIMLS